MGISHQVSKPFLCERGQCVCGVKWLWFSGWGWAHSNEVRDFDYLSTFFSFCHIILSDNAFYLCATITHHQFHFLLKPNVSMHGTQITNTLSLMMWSLLFVTTTMICERVVIVNVTMIFILCYYFVIVIIITAISLLIIIILLICNFDCFG